MLSYVLNHKLFNIYLQLFVSYFKCKQLMCFQTTSSVGSLNLEVEINWALVVCFVLDIFPVVFEGGKLVVNKGLSSHFQISHTMTMSSLQPSGYKFGCTYVGTKQYSPSEASQVFVTTFLKDILKMSKKTFHNFVTSYVCWLFIFLALQKWSFPF